MNNINKSLQYHLIHEFSDLEEIKESFSEISSNIRMLRFIARFISSPKKKFFATINCLNTGKFFADKISTPLDLRVVNTDQYLFDKISNKIFVKVLIEIEF